MSKVGELSLQPGIRMSGGAGGSVGGEVEGAVARQNGRSTALYQSAGEGGAGDGPGLGGLGGAGGGNGPFVQVVHFGSAPIVLIADNGRK